MHLAALCGKEEIVSLLLDYAYSLENKDDIMAVLNCTNNAGMTPLALAASKRHAEVVCKLILHIGAEIVLDQLDDEAFKTLILNTGSKDNCTPLRLARRLGHEEIVIILLTKMLIQVEVPVFWSPDDCLEDILISLIDNEAEGVRIAIYYLSSLKIAQALIKTHKKGVSVECITEKRNTGKHSKVKMLQTAGIPIWKNRYSAFMHHKYAIFDKNFNNHSFVSTGSYNFTEHAKKNRENMIVFT